MKYALVLSCFVLGCDFSEYRDEAKVLRSLTDAGYSEITLYEEDHCEAEQYGNQFMAVQNGRPAIGEICCDYGGLCIITPYACELCE